MSKPIVPRYYQWDALNAFIAFFETLVPGIKANGCAVLPTGTGKSLVIAMLTKYFYERWKTREIILCHSAELIKQDYEKACEYWPEGKHLFGINSEGLGRRDYDNQIIFATIQSVCNTPELFFAVNKQPINVCWVDEVQRVPESGDGQYLSFFDYMLSVNEDFRDGGLTAADWRLGTGRICKPGNIMTHKIYEFPVMDAITNGFMATPINRATKYKVDRSKFKIQGGEFTDASVNEVMTEEDLIRNQIEEAIRTAEEFEREYWIVNCFSIIHANAVHKEIQRRGIVTDVVHSDVEKSKRKDIIAKYRERMTTSIIHVDMLSLGVDFPHSDYCVMMSPTNSSERYYQKVGRVLRVTPIPCQKCETMSVVVEDNCQECGSELNRTYKQKTGFILDQDGNVGAHGAINCDIASPDKGVRQKRRNKTKECKNPDCLEEVAIHLKICPYCETPFPTRERENKTLERAAHDQILVEPEWLDVDTHEFFVSVKKGVIQHHVFLKEDKKKVTNRLELGSSDPLKNKKAKQHLSKLLGDDIPKTVESFVDDGYREKVPCPVQVLVTQQTGFRRLEDYKFN